MDKVAEGGKVMLGREGRKEGSTERHSRKQEAQGTRGQERGGGGGVDGC